MSRLYNVEQDGTVTVKTASGWTVECLPVADLLLRAGQNVIEPIEPDVPLYTVVGINEATEQRVMDDAVAADPATSQEDRDRWAEYLEAKAVYDQEKAESDRKRDEMRGRFMALRGVRVRDLPDDLESWATEQRELFGLPIEDNGLPHERALLLAFVNNDVVRSRNDGLCITAGIMYASGMDQEALDSVEEMFLDQMGLTQGSDAETDSSIPATGADEEK